MKYLHFIESHNDITNIKRNWVDVVRCENEDHVHYRSINSNGHEYVDLDLPSGNLWATCNVGAASEKSIGYRYAWGEVDTGKSTYNWNNYVFGTSSNLTKYVDVTSKLLLRDDAVHAEWGGDWHIPSTEDFIELYENTNQNAYYNDKGVHIGIYFTSKVDSTKSIFLPSCSYQSGDNIMPSPRAVCCWTNDIYGDDITKALFFWNITASGCEVTYVSRCVGMPVRPIITQVAYNEPLDYVNDNNLLLFLDAIDNNNGSHSSNTTTWTDRVQKLPFTVSSAVTSTDRNKYNWFDNYITSQGYTYTYEPPYFRNDWYPNFSNGDFTLVMVYRGNEVTTVRQDYIMGTAGGNHGSNNRWQLTMENGNVNLYHNNGSWVNEFNVPMPQKDFNVLVLTKSENRLVFYINGRPIDYGTTTKTFGGTDGFAVRITNLLSHCYMVYDRALSSKEVWQTYHWANNYYKMIEIEDV